MLIVPVHPQSGKRVNRVGTRGLVEHEGYGGCDDVENELLKRVVLSLSRGRVRSTLCVYLSIPSVCDGVANRDPAEEVEKG
jgi:hypothetical protein